MKTQQECFEALAAGHTLRHKARVELTAKFINGALVVSDGTYATFGIPSDWEIYKEPLKAEMICEVRRVFPSKRVGEIVLLEHIDGSDEQNKILNPFGGKKIRVTLEEIVE